MNILYGKNIPNEVYHNYAKLGYKVNQYCKKNNIEVNEIFRGIKK